MTARRVLSVLTNRNFLLVTGALLGVFLDDAARVTRPLIVPALALAMTASLVSVEAIDLRRWRQVLGMVLPAIALTYLLQGGLKLLLARAMGFRDALWMGFVLEAAVPCGAAVVPLSHSLGGDTVLSLVGSLGVYFSALVLMPLTVTSFGGTGAVSPLSLVPVLVQLIVLPTVVARLITYTRLKACVERWRGTIVNCAFALLFYTIVGLNRHALVSEPAVAVRGALIAVLCSFGLGFGLDNLLKRWGVDRQRRISYVLLATIKNTALAAATALALFGERAALPAAIVSAVNVIYMIWLGVRWP